MEAQYYQDGLMIDHTPAAALAGGQVIQLESGPAAVAGPSDIAANVKGAVYIEGIFKIQAAAVTGVIDTVVGWDEDGDPYGGTAGSGAATTSLVDADFIIGSLAAALTATDGYAYVRLNKYSLDQPAFANRVHELKSDNYTVDAEDSGKVLHIATDAKAFTLPDCTTVPGLDVIFQNDGADGAVALSISPAAADKIMGPDVAGTDNKDQINTKATARRGDFMHLRSEGVAGWWIIEKRGTWAEEA